MRNDSHYSKLIKKLPPPEHTSESIAEDTARFLRSGGRIRQYPAGESSREGRGEAPQGLTTSPGDDTIPGQDE